VNEDSLRVMVEAGVRAALLRVDRRISPSEPLDPAISLVDDLGLDSVRFIELTLELEDALGLAALPLQRWSDDQADRASDRYTFGSLVAFCVEHARRS